MSDTATPPADVVPKGCDKSNSHSDVSDVFDSHSKDECCDNDNNDCYWNWKFAIWLVLAALVLSAFHGMFTQAAVHHALHNPTDNYEAKTVGLHTGVFLVLAFLTVMIFTLWRDGRFKKHDKKCQF